MGELSVGRTDHWANCPLDDLSIARNAHWANCPLAKLSAYLKQSLLCEKITLHLVPPRYFQSLIWRTTEVNQYGKKNIFSQKIILISKLHCYLLPFNTLTRAKFVQKVKYNKLTTQYTVYAIQCVARQSRLDYSTVPQYRQYMRLIMTGDWVFILGDVKRMIILVWRVTPWG